MEQPKNYRDEDNNKVWYLPSKGKEYQHRLGGPAIEYVNGHKLWFVNNKQHRLDGPAIEWANGHKLWFVDGKIHRLDGPAYEGIDGDKEWYVNGKRLPPEEVKAWLEENDIDLKTKEGQMVFKLRWM